MATAIDIHLHELGKRFRAEWIVKGLNYVISSGSRLAITGPNGSGKSTLLRMLSGYLSPSKGRVQYMHGNTSLDIEAWYQHLSFAAPYVELIEEFTLNEALHFHVKLKPLGFGLDIPALIQILRLEHAKNQEIRFFSSGMKQRLKLALAICSQSEVLILDEPSTNLDAFNTSWYLDLIDQFALDRSIIVASNVAQDFRYCDQQLSILDYKGTSISRAQRNREARK